MKTTLSEIKNYNPCFTRWENAKRKVKEMLGKDYMYIKITPIQILDAVGLEDAIWCLRVFEYMRVKPFIIDVIKNTDLMCDITFQNYILGTDINYGFNLFAGYVRIARFHTPRVIERLFREHFGSRTS